MIGVTRHFSKIDGSNIYDEIMLLVYAAERANEIKSATKGFVDIRAAVDDSGKSFSVTQYWETLEDYQNLSNNPEHQVEVNKFLEVMNNLGIKYDEVIAEHSSVVK